MITVPVTYTNFNEVERTEQLCFNLTKIEFMRMEAFYANRGGTQAVLERLSAENDARGIMEFFEDLLERAYGVREGDNFYKDPRDWARFAASEAYSQFFDDLMDDEDKSSAFVSELIHNQKKHADAAAANRGRRAAPQDFKKKQTTGIKSVPEVPTVDRRPEEDANTNAFQQFPTEPTVELATAPAVIEEKPELTREQIANMTSEQLRAYYMG